MRKRFSVSQYENGLTVVMEHMPGAVSTAAGFMVRTGARDEPAAMDGVSHFLEHMMFKGTATRSWMEINRDFDRMGARYNAYTSIEETCYYAWVLKDELPKALELLSDMLKPALPDEELNAERKVVLEEIARYRDVPDHVIFEEAMKTAFKGQRVASNVLGTPRTVGRMTRDEMKEYFDRRYTAANITLFACGNFDPALVLAEIEKHWATRAKGEQTPPHKPPVFTPGARLIRKKDINRQHLVYMWPSLCMRDRRSVAASLLGAIYGDDRNSRLYWALRHTGLSEEAGGGYYGFSDSGVMVASASCDPDKAVKVAGILREEAAKLRKGIKKEELQRVKNRIRTSLVFRVETPFNRFREIMQEWSISRELWTMEDALERINQVSLKDLYALLEEFPVDGPEVFIGMGPLEKLKTGGRTLTAR